MSTENVVMSIIDQHGLRKSGKRFVGPCPECGGSAKSDKFQIRLDGGFKCYACSFRGDILTWLTKKEGLSCPDAHDKANKECRMNTTCAVAETCRHGNTINSAPKKQFRRKKKTALPYSSTPAGREKIAQLPTINPSFPPAEWVAYFTALAEKANSTLLANQEQMDYLASRGIDSAAVSRFRLGWLNHQYRVPKKDICLPIDDGKDKLWVPGDLLIPIMKKNSLHRIRIRRTPESRAKFIQDLKYCWIKGSGNLPLAIPAMHDRPRGAVIVEAELDGFAIAAAHHDVVVVAIGTVAAGIDQVMHTYLAGLPVILVALDAEQQAVDALQAWKNEFPTAKFWPTPSGKDAGEYYQQGGDLKEWIEAGLPPKLPSSASQQVPVQDRPFPPARKLNGGEGEEGLQRVDGMGEVTEVELTTGKTIYLVNEKNHVWDEMSAKGMAVFTRYEMERLKAATSTMNDEERIAAAAAVIEAKEMFGGYISRGVADISAQAVAKKIDHYGYQLEEYPPAEPPG